MESEPNARVTYTLDNGSVSVESLKTDGTKGIFGDRTANTSDAGQVAIGKSGYLYLHIPGNISGNAITVTFNNLQNSTYKGHKIAKIVAVIHDITVYDLLTNGHQIAVSDNPFYGYYEHGLKQFGVNYTYYDENGDVINFSNNNDVGGAWLSVGSLNSGSRRTEEAQLTSQGKAYGFYGSTVTVHNGNLIYSDHVNELDGNLKPAVGLPNGYGDNTPDSNLNLENKYWDSDKGLSDPNAYLGAGVFNVTGNDVDVNFIAQSQTPDIYSWFTISTIIPKDSFKIEPPKAEIHYHYDVNIQKEENLILPFSQLIQLNLCRYFYGFLFWSIEQFIYKTSFVYVNQEQLP